MTPINVIMAKRKYKCPICGSEIYLKKIAGNETSGEVTRFAAKLGGKSIAKVGGQVVGGLLGSLIGMPEDGAEWGGRAASMLAGQQIDKEFDKRKKSSKTICNCPTCSLKWDSSIQPQEVLDYIKHEKSISERAPKFDWFHVWVVLLLGPIVGAYWYYGLNNDTGLWWYLLLILMIPMSIIPIGSFSYLLFNELPNHIKSLKQTRRIRKMSLVEYVQIKNRYGMFDEDLGVDDDDDDDDE